MYYKEDKINYDRYMIYGLVLTLLILVGMTVYWLGENTRLAFAKESLTEERVHRGGEIFADQCASCHGTKGEGGVGTALNNKTLLRNTLDEILYSVIRSGVPSTQMPAWSVDFGGPLTDEDVKDAVAYLRSWEADAPVIEPVIFEPDANRGALLFETTCAICHGKNGSGDTAPTLNDIDRLTKLDDGWYRETIKNGRPARGMPTWGTVLSPNQIEDLIALFDAWRGGKSVTASFSITDLLNSAIFSLEEGDPESAALQVERSVKIAEGAAAEVLRNADAQMKSGDPAGALVTLKALQDLWPLGDATVGAVTYSTYCSPCHGQQGEGGIGVALNPNDYIQSEKNAALIEFILEGREGTAMAGFDGRLAEEELADVLAFLRLWQEP